jgi:preprotein translocase subunit YajC
MLTEIEKNIEERKETDRVMWFSMWVLLSVASFGIAWFIMIYFLVKRRNDHFLRQEKLETLILRRLRQLSREKPRHQNSSAVSAKAETPEFFRNAQAWALSTLLIFPAFYIFYFLKMDLQKHEEHEHSFLTETISLTQDSGLNIRLDGFAMTRKYTLDRYLILTIVTGGFAAIYWLYRIFNDYNQHFKRQWKLEDDMLKFFKSTNNSKAS